MAGHSKFKNIMHRTGAQDAKRAKVFTKIIRELTVAAKTGGADPNANPRLRLAMQLARVSNMTKDTMERAIKRGAGGEDTADYQEVRYEGYGPNGVAVIVETLTDNRNRTAPDVRSTFTKNGGNLGETNSVSFMFDHVGAVVYPAKAAGPDAMMDAAIEAGAENVESDEESHEITCAADDLAAVRDFLESKFGPANSAKLVWKPKIMAPISGDAAKSLLKLIDTLEDNDDVQVVYSNFDISEDELETLAG